MDVIDLGFGNPDIPSPQIAVEKLAEAARIGRNHRYSMSPRPARSCARRSPRCTSGAGASQLDTELEITNTIGSKEGFSHLMWVLLRPRRRGHRARARATRSTSTGRCSPAPTCARCRCAASPTPRVQQDFAGDFFDSLETAWDVGWPKPRVLVISFPHNPTGSCVDLTFMQRVVDFCREREMIVVHDFAYADIGFDGYDPPSILQAEGAKECAVELYSMTKSFSMAGWRCAFLVGNAEVVQALVKLKSYLDYGTFQPIQIAATVTMNEAPDYPKEVCAIYQARRDALIDGLGRIGWDIPKPKGTMFVWAPIPEPYQEMDSVEFCSMVVRECDVALSPGRRASAPAARASCASP